MIFDFEFIGKIADGENAAVFQDIDGLINLIYTPIGEEKLQIQSTEINQGDFSNINFGATQSVTTDKNIKDLSLKYLPDQKVWFIWTSGQSIRQAVYEEEETEIYDSQTPYRLWYSVDTEKLYMNISDNWEFIASPSITLLKGYQELIDKINELENRINQGGTGASPNTSEYWLNEFRIDGINCLDLNGILLDNNATKNDIIAEIKYTRPESYLGLFLNLKEEYANYTITVTVYHPELFPVGYSYDWDEIKDIVADQWFPSGIEAILITISNQNNEQQIYGIKFVRTIDKIFKARFLGNAPYEGYNVEILDDTREIIEVRYALILPYEFEYGDIVLVVDNVIVGKIQGYNNIS